MRPSRSARDFYTEVAARTGQDQAYAADLSRATLTTLAERIRAREAHELARQLPGELAGPVAGVEHDQPLSSDEYLARAADRAQVDTRAVTRDAPVIMAVLASMLADGELEYLRAALPADYAWLFGDAPTPPPPAALATNV
jgi:uncharacterized protein (DUF2267 family)